MPMNTQRIGRTLNAAQWLRPCGDDKARGAQEIELYLQRSEMRSGYKPSVLNALYRVRYRIRGLGMDAF